jgi:hypothetical protein
MPAPPRRARRRPRSTTATSRRPSRRSARASPSTTRSVESPLPPPLVLGLIWEGESGSVERCLGEMGWEYRIFLVNASLCDVLCCVLGGDRDAEKDPDFAPRALVLKLTFLTKMAFFISIFHFILRGRACWR